MSLYFITGNQSKADYLAKYLGYPIAHKKINLDEIQSLDLKEIVKHKVRQAYAEVGEPVLVEDVSLEFSALGGLPGPFIKFFLDKTGLETTCSLLDGKSREATARCVYGYFDGKEEAYFEGSLRGTIPEKPSKSGGFGGWDPIFIPDGYTVTRAELNEEDDQKTYLKIKPLEQIKSFLEKKNN